MKTIGKRISILRKEEEGLLSIVILPSAERSKLVLLFLWLLAWSVCGVIVFVNYFATTDANVKLFIIIYLAFWAYFEFNILRTFIWKRSGKEKLWINHGTLHYQREVSKRGKVREFNLDLVEKLKVLELSKTRLADTVNQSFWVRGGERLQFESQGRAYPFAMQVTDEEARVLFNEISSFLRTVTKSR